MNFSSVVEITSVFPGTIGGCVFWGVPAGKKRSNPFKVKYTVGIRNPLVGEQWAIKGRITEYDKYNKQVIVREAKFQGLPTGDYIVKFLAKHPKFRGFDFGPKGAAKVAADIGTLELVKLLNKGDWKTISDARISESKAQRICEEWHDLKEETELVTFLTENKLDDDLSRQIIRMCKFNTVERLKRNPYALIALSNCSKNKTLKTVSAVAKAQNISSNDDRSLICCVEFALYQELHHGHTITKLDAASKSIQRCLDIIGSNITAESAIKTALAARTICIYEAKNKLYLQSISLAYIERSVEKALISLYKTPIQDSLFATQQGLSKRIEQYSQDHKAKNKWGFVPKQCAAV
jgi:exodeoxyribonuclease V alpha subunit